MFQRISRNIFLTGTKEVQEVDILICAALAHTKKNKELFDPFLR